MTSPPPGGFDPNQYGYGQDSGAHYDSGAHDNSGAHYNSGAQYDSGAHDAETQHAGTPYPQDPFAAGGAPAGQPAPGGYGAPAYDPNGFGPSNYGPSSYGPSGYGPGAYGAAGYGSGYPVPGYPASPKPSGGTGIAAGVLALLGVVHMAIGFVVMAILALAFLAVTSDPDYVDIPGWLTFMVAIGALINGVLVILLGWGGIALLMRKSIGRILVMVGSGAVIAVQLLSLVVSSALPHYVNDDFAGEDLGFSLVFTIVLLIFPVLTLVLAALSSTKQWIDFDNQLPVGPPPAAPPAWGAPPQY